LIEPTIFETAAGAANVAGAASGLPIRWSAAPAALRLLEIITPANTSGAEGGSLSAHEHMCQLPQSWRVAQRFNRAASLSVASRTGRGTDILWIARAEQAAIPNGGARASLTTLRLARDDRGWTIASSVPNDAPSRCAEGVEWHVTKGGPSTAAINEGRSQARD
jgi:hypothetical protein